MNRRNAIIAVAVVALGIAGVSIAEAGGGGGSGGKGRRPSTPAPVTTTRKVTNSTSRSWYTYIYSGTGVNASTVSQANAQGAKVIAPGNSAVFNVKPDGGGNPFGDTIYVNAVPPLDVNDPNASIKAWGPGNGSDGEYPFLKAGQTMTITITQSGTDTPVNFIPPPP
jgi:hypothetical protein